MNRGEYSTGKMLVAGLAMGFAFLDAASSQAAEDLLDRARAVFQSLPTEAANQENPATPARVELGRMLFHDPRLSKSGAISCASCHNLSLGGADGRPTSIGHGWTIGLRNAPTVLNAALHIAQFWDGRAKDVEEQAKGPVLNPKEMASPSPEFVVARLSSIPAYVALFKDAFRGDKQALTYDHAAQAIAAFERTLLTPSRFDRFLGGDEKTLSAAEREGLKLFLVLGCAACHSGATVGGTMFQKFGVVQSYWEETGSAGRDAGRFDQTGQESDRYVFKVPSLRNAERTAPYFHDGSVWELEEAVRVMAKVQLGRVLSQKEAGKVAVFLRSLTGEIPAGALALPTLPPSTPSTSRPDAR